MYRAFYIALLLLLAGPASAQDRPLVMAHYMPWYQSPEVSGYWGWHWTMGTFNLDAKDATGRRELASHYYPTIGPYDSRDPDVLEYHMLLMKMSGIDGVIVDWYGIQNVYDYAWINETTQLIFNAAKRAGLVFAVCYEDRSVASGLATQAIPEGGGVAHAAEVMQYLSQGWFSDSSYARVDGKPIMLVFGPEYFKKQDEWLALLKGIGDDPLAFMLDRRYFDAAAGGFAWPPMWKSGGGELDMSVVHDYLTNFETEAARWPHFVTGAFPGFNDIYAQTGRTSYGHLADRGGLTFRETFVRALNAEADVIQLITWNDFAEGTNIEPTREYGYRYLEEVQSAARAKWNASLAYQASDFELTTALFEWRKRYKGDRIIKALLDGAASALLAGNTSAARALLMPPVGVESAEQPDAMRLDAAFPNPFSAEMTVRYTLPVGTAVRSTLTDMLGRPVRARDLGHQGPGPYEVRWNTTDLAPGVYVVRVEAGGTTTARTLVRR